MCVTTERAHSGVSAICAHYTHTRDGCSRDFVSRTVGLVTGARSAQSIVDTCVSKLKSLVNERLSGKKSGGGGGGGGGKVSHIATAVNT